MTKAQLIHMITRFLAWKLPANFSPDGGITFDRFANSNTPYKLRREPSGTNLLDYHQAKEMVEHITDQLPPSEEVISLRRQRDDLLEANNRYLQRARDAEVIIAEVHAWAVCGAITTPEDMAQNLPHIADITAPKGYL